MFLNISEINHYYTSFTRIYMAILMVAPMAVVMMLMMGEMYPDKKMNVSIIAGAIFGFSKRSIMGSAHRSKMALTQLAIILHKRLSTNSDLSSSDTRKNR